jgi:hypothetical protein
MQEETKTNVSAVRLSGVLNGLFLVILCLNLFHHWTLIGLGSRVWVISLGIAMLLLWTCLVRERSGPRCLVLATFVFACAVNVAFRLS